MLRRILVLSLLVALLGAVGCSGSAKSTPPANLNAPIPDAAVSGGGGGKAKPPAPPTGKAQ
jgi:hypothetical protein